MPPIRRLEGQERALLLGQLGRRWRPVGWGALAVLVVTGLASAGEHGGFRLHRLAHGGFGVVLVVKAVLVVVLTLAVPVLGVVLAELAH